MVLLEPPPDGTAPLPRNRWGQRVPGPVRTSPDGPQRARPTTGPPPWAEPPWAEPPWAEPPWAEPPWAEPPWASGCSGPTAPQPSAPADVMPARASERQDVRCTLANSAAVCPIAVPY